MTLESDKKHLQERISDTTTVDENKKTILIYSPDLNFCFSLSMLFQDRYNVITTTSVSMLEELVVHYAASLLIVDASPTSKLVQLLHRIKGLTSSLPIIMLYVFSPKESNFDAEARREVDAVFYKPFDLGAMSRRISELLPA